LKNKHWEKNHDLEDRHNIIETGKSRQIEEDKSQKNEDCTDKG